MRMCVGIMMLAACGGGVVDEPGTMDPETPEMAEPLPFSVTLVSPSEGPIVTAEAEVELRFHAPRRLRELKVGEVGGLLVGEDWVVKLPIPAGDCSGEAPSHAFSAQGFDENGFPSRTTEVLVIRDSCAPKITLLSAEVRDESAMAVSFDPRGPACLWRDPAQPAVAVGQAPVARYAYQFVAAGTPALCQPPHPGWISAHDNAMRLRFRVEDDVGMDLGSATWAVAYGDTGTAPATVVGTVEGRAVVYDVTLPRLEVRGAEDAGEWTFTLTASDGRTHTSAASTTWNQALLPGPFRIIPFSQPALVTPADSPRGISPSTCSLKGTGSILPCIDGTNAIDAGNDFVIENPTPVPLKVVLDAVASVDFYTSPWGHEGAVSTLTVPASAWPCGTGDVWMWWPQTASSVCFVGYLGPVQPQQYRSRTDFIREILLEDGAASCGGNCVIVPPRSSVRGSVVANPFTEIAAMTGFGPAAPRLRDYTNSEGRRATGFLSALTGNAVASGSNFVINHRIREFWFLGVSAKVDTTTHGERGITARGNFASGDAPAYQATDLPLKFDWWSNEDIPFTSP